jgi:hypothetical protein
MVSRKGKLREGVSDVCKDRSAGYYVGPLLENWKVVL